MSEFAAKQPIVAGLRNEKTWRESNPLDRGVVPWVGALAAGSGAS